MAGITASMAFSLQALITGSPNLGSASARASISKSLELRPGTAIDQADLMFADDRSLSENGVDNLDLNGAWLSPLGEINSAQQAILIYVECISGSLVIGNANYNPFLGPLNAGGSYALETGEFVMFSSRTGYPVTAGTGDILAITSGLNGAEYKILILARSIAASLVPTNAILNMDGDYVLNESGGYVLYGSP